MSQMTKSEIQAAMDQITNCVVSITLHRLSPNEIEEITRPKKRRVKRRYTSLDFNDDNEYFEKTCSLENWYPQRKYRKRRKQEKSEPLRKKKLSSYLSTLSENMKNEKPCAESVVCFEEVKPQAPIKQEMELSDMQKVTFSIRIKEEYHPKEEQQPIKSTFVSKIRIKTAAELGSTIRFVNLPKGCNPTSKSSSLQHTQSNLIGNENKSTKVVDKHVPTKFSMLTILELYKLFFNKENREVIKKVAEVLQNLLENIKRKNDKLEEITNSRSTDAEKLMLRHQAHGEFNRVKMSNQFLLKEYFESISKIFDHDHFEILFQLFFLGILKMCIVSVSNKKGTLFKKIVSLLSQSLSSCNYENERVFNLLKSKTFRADCINLVDSIEKCSETKFFEMLFISDEDKKKILNSKNCINFVNIPELKQEAKKSSSNCPLTLSRSASIVKYTSDMNVQPVGANLFLHCPSQSSSSIAQHLIKTDTHSTGSQKPAKLVASTSIKGSSAQTIKYAPNILKTNTVPRAAGISDINRTSSCRLPFPNATTCSIISSPSSSQNPLSNLHPVSHSNFSTLSYSVNTVSNNTTLTTSSSIIPRCFHQTLLKSVVTNSTSEIPFTVIPNKCSNQPANYTPNVVVKSAMSSPSAAAARTHSVIVGSCSTVPSSNNNVLPSPIFTAVNAPVTFQDVGMHLSQLPLQQQTNCTSTESTTSEHRPEDMNGSNLYTEDVETRSNFALRTYGRPKDLNRGIQCCQITPAPSFFPVGCGSNCCVSNTAQFSTTLSTTPSHTVHHFMVPRIHGNGVASLQSNTGQTHNGFSPYRQMSVGINNENIQPSSPHDGQLSSPHDSRRSSPHDSQLSSPHNGRLSSPHDSRLTSPHNSHLSSPHDCRLVANSCNINPKLNDHNYTHLSITNATASVGSPLRSLLCDSMRDSGCAPLVHENCHSDVPYSYMEKSNCSPDMPTVISPNSIVNDTRNVPNHIPMASCVGGAYSC